MLQFNQVAGVPSSPEDKSSQKLQTVRPEGSNQIVTHFFGDRFIFGIVPLALVPHNRLLAKAYIKYVKCFEKYKVIFKYRLKYPTMCKHQATRSYRARFVQINHQ